MMGGLIRQDFLALAWRVILFPCHEPRRAEATFIKRKIWMLNAGSRITTSAQKVPSFGGLLQAENPVDFEFF